MISTPITQPIPRRPDPYIKPTDQLRKVTHLSKGSFGDVYIYENMTTKQLLVIKIIPYGSDPQLNKIRREIDFLYKYSDNPHLCKFYDHFVMNNQAYLVMERIDGHNLYDGIYKPKKKLERRILCSLIMQICEGLLYLHQNKLIHRDLKLENIMITAKGKIKIIDLGESNYYGEGQSRKTRRGTLTYFCPEVLNGDEQTDKVDVWCLGVIIFELVCFELPFFAPNEPEIQQKIRRFKYAMHPNIKDDPDLLDLFARIFTWKEHRISIEDIIKHPWMTKNLSAENRIKLEDLIKDSEIPSYRQLLQSQIQKIRHKIADQKCQNTQLSKLIEQTRLKTQAALDQLALLD